DSDPRDVSRADERVDLVREGLGRRPRVERVRRRQLLEVEQILDQLLLVERHAVLLQSSGQGGSAGRDGSARSGAWGRARPGTGTDIGGTGRDGGLGRSGNAGVLGRGRSGAWGRARAGAGTGVG